MVKLFELFKAAYNHKWNSSFQTDAQIKLGIELWSRHLANYSGDILLKSIDECITTLEWPPSIAEFVKLCDKHSGIPTITDIIQSAVRGDLSHPLTKLIYDKIGSWDFKHATQQELERKVAEHYKPMLTETRRLLV